MFITLVLMFCIMSNEILPLWDDVDPGATPLMAALTPLVLNVLLARVPVRLCCFAGVVLSKSRTAESKSGFVVKYCRRAFLVIFGLLFCLRYLRK